jgi:hypothetical protein
MLNTVRILRIKLLFDVLHFACFERAIRHEERTILCARLYCATLTLTALIIAVEWDSMGSWRTDGRRSAANASSTTTLASGSVEIPKRLLGADSGMFLSPLGARTPPVIRQSNSGSECEEFQPELVPEGLKIPPRNMGLKPFSREEMRIQDHFGDHGPSILSLSNDNIKCQRLSDNAADNFSNDDFDSESVVSFQTQNIKPKSGKKNFGGKRDLHADPMSTTTSTASITGQRNFVVKKARALRDNAKQKNENDRQKSALRKGRNVNLKKIKVGVEAERAAAATAALSMTASDMGKQEAKKLKKDGREVPSNVLKEELSMEVGNIPQLSAKISIPLVVSLVPQRNKTPTIGSPSGHLLSMETLPPPVDDLDMDCADEISVHSKMTSDNDDDDDGISSSFEGSSLERDGFAFANVAHDVHTAPSVMSAKVQPLKTVARTSYSASGASSPTSSPLFIGGNVLGGRSVGGSPINGRKNFYPGSPGHFPKNNGVTSGGRNRSEAKQSGLGGLLGTDESARWAKVGSRPHSHSISPLRSHSSKRKERDISADFAAAIMSSMTDVMNGVPSDSESSFPSPSNSGHTNSFGMNNPRCSIPPHNIKLNNNSSSATELKQQQAVYRRAAGPSDAKNLSRNPKEMKGTGMGMLGPGATAGTLDPALASEGILIVVCSQSKSLLSQNTGPTSSAHSNKQRSSREKDRDREKEMKMKRGSSEFFVTGNPPGLSLDSLRINGTVAGIGVTRMSINIGDEKEKDKNDKYRTFRDKEKEEKEKDDKEGKLPVYDSDPNDDDCSVNSISQSNLFVNPSVPEKRFNRLRKEDGEEDLMLQAPMVLEEHGAAVTCLRK